MNDLITQSWGVNPDGAHVPLLSAPEKEQKVDSSPISDGSFQQFNDSVNAINDLIEKANEMFQIMQSTHTKLEMESSPKLRRALESTMEANSVKLNKCFREMNTKLDALKVDNFKNREREGSREGSSMDLLRKNITLGVANKIMALQKNVGSLKDECESGHREMVQRQLQIVTGNPPKKEDVDAIIAKGSAENLLQVAVSNQGRGEVMDAIFEIQERSVAAADIKNNLEELLTMFVQLDSYVKVQGEQIDMVDVRVQEIAQVMDVGLEDLKKASLSRRKNRKWKFLLITIALLLLVILIVALIYQLSS